MPSRQAPLLGLIVAALLVLLLIGLLVGAGAMLSSWNSTTQALPCEVSAPGAQDTSLPVTGATSSGRCYPGNPYGAQVVAWARQMADALYVDPACGNRRGGDCNDTWYTNAFPQAVIQYGQSWCQTHGDCSDWASGSYQCVSFVRGAYSQVYPMTLSNNAFALWATYQHLAGWQEIPAAATPNLRARGLPEPGDVMVFKDSGVGHVAIVIAVQPPTSGHSGWITFANANSSSAYDRMPLLANLTVDTSEWGSSYIVWGYLRPLVNASARLVRLSQLDPAQYVSQAEDATWAYSACSAAAMTEVLDAYGLRLRIHDVLQVEASLGAITPQLGLTNEAGIAATVQRFGFQTNWGDHWSLEEVIARANAGTPVIVSWPPARYDGGHIVVVTGGDSQQVFLADSSAWNRARLSRTQFLQWWAGFAALVTPA
jgi:hypothetical protein